MNEERMNVELQRLVRLYRRASKAAAKSNALLNECSELEEEMFGTTRGDTDKDALIDRLEYAAGGGSKFGVKEVREIWQPNANCARSAENNL